MTDTCTQNDDVRRSFASSVVCLCELNRSSGCNAYRRTDRVCVVRPLYMLSWYVIHAEEDTESLTAWEVRNNFFIRMSSHSWIGKHRRPPKPVLRKIPAHRYVISGHSQRNVYRQKELWSWRWRKLCACGLRASHSVYYGVTCVNRIISCSILDSILFRRINKTDISAWGSSNLLS